MANFRRKKINCRAVKTNKWIKPLAKLRKKSPNTWCSQKRCFLGPWYRKPNWKENVNKTTTTYEIITNNLGYSDHDAQILTITRNINTDTINNTRMCRAFTKVNIKLFTDYLMKESWDEVYNAVDTNEKYNLFFSKLSIHFNACFPLKREN